MKEQAQIIREVARQALYNTPNDQECEVPIMVATLKNLREQLTLPYGASVWKDEKGMWYDAGRKDCLKEIDGIIDELEKLK